MTTYRELLARRNEFAIYSPEWKEIGDLIDATSALRFSLVTWSSPT